TTTRAYETDNLGRLTKVTDALFGEHTYSYDENGVLYGFIKDNSAKYLYIRDVYQNILGIIDNTGAIVVKYSYDAWGYHKVLDGNGNVDWKVASVTGLFNGITSAISSYVIIAAPLISTALKPSLYLAEALKFSLVGASVGVYLSSLIPNFNNKRN
ncbi:MAG: hypothetical protein NC325_06620, partial [Anaeroplasma bactoclasticum]|nr:hypothetical protein [Anaeroplasma bactoclasticum]